VLVMVMRKHQRYFPIVAAPGGPDSPLLPAFITVANGDVDQGVVVAGEQQGTRFACVCFSS